jgi:hypothetical protein
VNYWENWKKVNELAQNIYRACCRWEEIPGMEKTLLYLEGPMMNIRRLALACLRMPYRYGAKRWEGFPIHFPDEFDCSSFVHALYKAIGVNIPKRSLEQASAGEPKPLPDHFQIGDLIFFRSDRGSYNRQYPDGVGHVVMYIGKIAGREMVIGACGTFPYEEREVVRVILIDLSLIMRRKDYRGARRILSAEQLQSG